MSTSGIDRNEIIRLQKRQKRKRKLKDYQKAQSQTSAAVVYDSDEHDAYTLSWSEKGQKFFFILFSNAIVVKICLVTVLAKVYKKFSNI